MAEQTEKAFLKQPNVFLSSKGLKKKRAPGKGGNRFSKSIGLGFKTPREATEVSVKPSTSWGTLASKIYQVQALLELCFLATWLLGLTGSEYEKRHSNIPAHISPCFRVKEGDHVIIGQCRPLSKTVRFNVLKVIPAGSSGGGKKAFTAI
ncbi:hypothetical protein Scep_023899 [Stephania cephalantha]|uniref:Small ribosomal subunit protein uS17 N-terminal domain-containing protein n=1 Tax=Stephania cephalantha TaxID=152367 RepID=A0AAP0HXW2_9MAGN